MEVVGGCGGRGAEAGRGEGGDGAEAGEVDGDEPFAPAREIHRIRWIIRPVPIDKSRVIVMPLFARMADFKVGGFRVGKRELVFVFRAGWIAV